jgi:chorismate synthase
MFRFTTAGESHGRALIAIVEGLPAGLPVSVESINRELERRQWGYGRGGRMKIERDRAEILSGVRHGQTLGSPVALMIENKDWKNWTDVMSAEAREGEIAPERARRVKRPRPGHADLAGGLKYGARDLRDILERASARETAARVACWRAGETTAGGLRREDIEPCRATRRRARRAARIAVGENRGYP